MRHGWKKTLTVSLLMLGALGTKHSFAIGDNFVGVGTGNNNASVDTL